MFLRFKSIIRADTGTGGKETSILDGRGQQEGRKRRGTEVEAATAAGPKEKEEWKGGGVGRRRRRRRRKGRVCGVPEPSLT